MVGLKAVVDLKVDLVANVVLVVDNGQADLVPADLEGREVEDLVVHVEVDDQVKVVANARNGHVDQSSAKRNSQ